MKRKQLSKEKRKEIYERWTRYRNYPGIQTTLAKKYGVSQQAINHITQNGKVADYRKQMRDREKTLIEKATKKYQKRWQKNLSNKNTKERTEEKQRIVCELFHDHQFTLNQIRLAIGVEHGHARIYMETAGRPMESI